MQSKRKGNLKVKRGRRDLVSRSFACQVSSLSHLVPCGSAPRPCRLPDPRIACAVYFPFLLQRRLTLPLSLSFLLPGGLTAPATAEEPAAAIKETKKTK